MWDEILPLSNRKCAGAYNDSLNFTFWCRFPAVKGRVWPCTRGHGEAPGPHHPGEDQTPEKAKLWLPLLNTNTYFPLENKPAFIHGTHSHQPCHTTTPCQQQDCPALPDAFFSPLPVVISTYSCDLAAADEAVGEYPSPQGHGSVNPSAAEVHAIDNAGNWKKVKRVSLWSHCVNCGSAYTRPMWFWQEKTPLILGQLFYIWQSIVGGGCHLQVSFGYRFILWSFYWSSVSDPRNRGF